jgi:hypothetical protein
MKKTIICIITVILLSGLLPIYACKDETSPLAHNEKLWQSKHIQDYSYRLDIGGNFRPPPMGNFLVRVKGGNPAGFSRLDQPGDTNNQNVIKYDTFEKVFAILEQSYQDTTLHVDVTYDATYGFPTYVGIYSLKDSLDFRDMLTISAFTPA